ncbi:MAG: nucleotidyltransferase domain-containing protein [Phycisphaerales bacterium]|nr:nucleotidyltransferase domain-containing protein [Phycisphaerales bacterium]
MVSTREINAVAHRIAAEFRPDRIILFGSYAYGKPTRDSDVDLLVVMPYSGHAARMAGEILFRADPTFAVDILVRSPSELKARYRMRDWFIREIIDRGKVVYEAGNGRMGRKG